jgi:nucleoside 2-deoxyribosyltransferase
VSKHFYLAGSITHADGASSWRQEAANNAPAGWLALDPMVFELARNVTPKEIVKLDYGLIMKSSAVIVKVEEPSWGTAMELAFAKQHAIPVIAFLGERAKFIWEKQSPWLRYHVSKVVPDLPGALMALVY